jgi:precorrin-4 methylase
MGLYVSVRKVFVKSRDFANTYVKSSILAGLYVSVRKVPRLYEHLRKVLNFEEPCAIIAQGSFHKTSKILNIILISVYWVEKEVPFPKIVLLPQLESLNGVFPSDRFHENL